MAVDKTSHQGVSLQPWADNESGGESFRAEAGRFLRYITTIQVQ